jgi:hypothetical protein
MLSEADALGRPRPSNENAGGTELIVTPLGAVRL